MTITIDHIAQHLNLAVSTVSKSLNGYSDVSQKTRNRVIETARELGYHPSAAARSLRRQRTDKIGFIFGFPIRNISDYAARLITGVMTATEAQGYNLILYPVMDNQIEQLTRISRTREVDGLLLMGMTHISQATQFLAQEEVPHVVVGRRVDAPKVSFVAPDDVAGALDVTRHLISLGHRRIGYTTRPELGMTSSDRLSGYQQSLNEAGLLFDDELVVETQVDRARTCQAINRLLDLPNPPTAIFAIHDLVAMACVEVAKSRGLRIPDDVAIVGFDDWRDSLLSDPPLTTVHPPLTEIGCQATQILLERISDRNAVPVRKLFKTELIVRQSTVNA